MSDTQTTRLQVLNRDAIKYIAVAAMTLNHIGRVLLEPGLLATVFIDVGFFTAIAMCYFLAEGYLYTRSKVSYGRRLALFAVISQFPFWFAFHGNFKLNMIFTLFVSFLILVVMERITNPILKWGTVLLMIVATYWSDWAFIAPIATVCFSIYRGNRKMLMLSFFWLAVAFAIFNTIDFMTTMSLLNAAIQGCLSALGILCSGVVVLFFYNGKRAQRAQTFSKWFFYVYYPAHLLIIGLIAYFI